MVAKVVYGRGSFDQLPEIIAPRRVSGLPFIFLVDSVFQHQGSLADRVVLSDNDQLIFVDATHEPKTTEVDSLRDQLAAQFPGGVSGVVGIGGGSVMDLAKAVALMLTNPGSSADYQGWDLIKQPGVYKVGIPTLSGTGAEVSRTAVLSGPVRKLGLNSDYTPFDQIVLDPELTQDAPVNQRFYTGMDCYIHCIESLQGTYLNPFSQSYGEQALELCRRVYVQKDHWDAECDDWLMMASFHGGMSIAYSQVGVAHAVSYGLSYVMGTRHGIGNCIVFNHLEEFYPEGVAEFKHMVAKHDITIPVNTTAGLSEVQFDQMADISLSMNPLWENALGPNWRDVMTRERLLALYHKL